MNKLLLKISGLASLVLLLHASGFAQQSSDDKVIVPDRPPVIVPDRARGYDEIIIRHKSDKDAKVTIEIKDGEVLVDGKPVSDFEDSALSIHQRKIKILRDGRNYSFSGPDNNILLTPEAADAYAQSITIAPTPFGSHGGVMNFNGDYMSPGSNRALLGVSSEKPSEGGGAKITAITEGSAAEKAGLRAGDLITQLDQTAVTSPESLSAAVRAHKPGDKVIITFKREGKVQKETAVLGKTGKTEFHSFQYKMPDTKDFDFNNMMPREFGEGMVEGFGNSMKFGIKAQDTEEGKGAKVLDVDDESAAAKAGIKEGDIITRFDGKEINSATALAEAARAAREKGSVKISLLRDGKPQEIEVKVPKRLRTANL